jgi:aldehyde:ferredoxin oxidoreductase
MKSGYRGRILEIELGERKSSVRELPKEDAVRFIGGSGLNAWLL